MLRKIISMLGEGSRKQKKVEEMKRSNLENNIYIR